MPDSRRNRVTSLIQRLGAGDAAVADELFALVYDELHAVAQRLFARQPANHTLQPTALVHEAWLKLAGNDIGWESRGHFFSVAARAMRQVLTDKARAQRAERRGKGRQKVTLDEELVAAPAGCDIVDLDDALQRLAAANQRHARVVELKLFAGLSLAEIATVLAVTPRTIQLDWRSASAFLRHVLDSPQTP